MAKQPMAALSVHKLEKLYGVEIRQNAISVMVQSTGCTSAKSFKLDISSDANQALQASVIRIKPDLCRAMPRMVKVEIFDKRLKESAAGVVINNPFYIKKSRKLKKVAR